MGREWGEGVRELDSNLDVHYPRCDGFVQFYISAF